MSNVKAGDLAVIVRSEFGNLGKLVRVLELSPLNGQPQGTRARIHGVYFKLERDSNELCWVVEALGSPLFKKSGRPYRVCPAGDTYLRPIRDPGEDAECNSKAWLPPVPSTNKETAA